MLSRLFSVTLSKACLSEVAQSRILFDLITVRVSYLFICCLSRRFYFLYNCCYNKFLAQFCHLQFIYVSFVLSFDIHIFFPLLFFFFLFFNVLEGVYFVLNSTCGYLLLFRVTFQNLWIIRSSEILTLSNL